MGFPNNEKATEGLCFPSVGGNYPTLTAAQLTAAVDMSKIRKAVCVVQAQTLGAAATVTAKIQGAVTSGGAYTDIPASSATLVKATDDNKAVILEISAEYLNALNLSYRYVKFSVSADVSSSATTTVIGTSGREEPVSALNATGVKTILALT